MRTGQLTFKGFLSLALFASPFGFTATAGAEGFWGAVKEGQWSGQLRPRYEFVDEDGKEEQANALTVRSQLNYMSGKYHGFQAELGLEAVTTLGSEKFNDTKNGKTDYPIVLDPEDGEVNVANLRYYSIPKTEVILGRQRVIFDNHRFVGTVPWRQNEVTMDGAMVHVKPVDGLTLSYMYLDNVNRLFGNSHPGDCSEGAACSDFDMNSHLLHVAYDKLPYAQMAVYGYFLDYEDYEAKSSQTIGARVSGKVPLSKSAKLLYWAEYASQSDYADGSAAIDADYYHLNLGGEVSKVLVRVGHEVLGGDGAYGFQTPLATVHAFQGWADRFLSTPANGVKDTYVEISGKAFGLKMKAVYHDFSADYGDGDYGSEIDLLVAKKFNKHLTVLAKYAAYQGDDGASGTYANDVNKFWLQANITF